jgi:hypothetical protein
MEIGEPVAISSLVDLSDECPFDHELDKPPELKNDLVGKGSTLATRMNNGGSTKLYKPFAPAESEKVKWGKLPQKDSSHAFFKGGPSKGRCVRIQFEGGETKAYPVSCSAHHLVPSQESLKGHPLLQYMCKKGPPADHNHGYGDGAVWSDVGYDTNGSENGVHLPGNYAVGGGKGGLDVWYPIDGEDDMEHDEGYIEVEKLPPEEYQDFLLHGEQGKISRTNACWCYVAQAMLKTPGQFHDRHLRYSEDIVKSALTSIFRNYQRNDVLINPGACRKCEERQKKLGDLGLPAPYSVVNRLETLSSRLRGYLTKESGSWRWSPNIFTSKWCESYMKAVLEGGKDKEEAEYFERNR